MLKVKHNGRIMQQKRKQTTSDTTLIFTYGKTAETKALATFCFLCFTESIKSLQ